MYLSLNWLKDFVDIPESVSPDDLGLRLTMHTVEIDGVEKQAEKLKNVVVGKVLEVKKHPNADRLRLVKVDIGKEILDIVCGAPNVEEGQLVPVALVGAVLPNGLEIKEASVRGERSCGMICAEDEIGLGSGHAGIMVLGQDARIGQELSEYLKLDDVIFEVDNKSITNRPDLWCHFGMAREISAFLDIDLKNEFALMKLENIKQGKEKLKVKVKDKDLCGRYMAVALEGIKIESSPKWMQERLMAVGIRPINNIVDVTNYVMFELGQPMHAFDKNLIDEIIVRRAEEGETIITLDNEEKKLDNDVLVIANGKKPLAVAGVMGGLDSGINDQTIGIVLESANFEPVSIRKTSQKIGIRTESSVRFEKSLDPNLCEKALIRAVQLIQEICPDAKISSQIADEQDYFLEEGLIAINLKWINQYIGESIEENRIKDILHSLGFGVKEVEDGYMVTVPTWRATKDISIKEDLVEEIARIYGYNNLIPTMPRVEMRVPEIVKEKALERKIKNILSGAGALTEVYNYSFVGEKQLKNLGENIDNYIRLANPIASHHSMLRQSLIPGVIENIKTNQARFEEIGIFEIGSVYFSEEDGVNKNNHSQEKLPNQEKRLALAVAGNDEQEAVSKIKGLVENLLSSLDFEVVYDVASQIPVWALKNSTTDIKIKDEVIGQIYVLRQEIQQKNGLKKKAVFAEINLFKLSGIAAEQGNKKYQELAKYPPVVRDLAFVVATNVLYNEIKKEILSFDKLIKSADLFDVYEGEAIGSGKRSMAFHVIYQADRTLTAEEVENVQQSLVKKMEKVFSAQIRSF